MDILLKGLVGGLVTALIAWLARKGSLLPGIIPLFPTLGLIALYVVGLEANQRNFQQTCLASLKTIPAYLAFILVNYLAIQRVDFRAALGLGILAWLLVALATFALPRFLSP